MRAMIRSLLPALFLASCAVPGSSAYVGFSTGVEGAPPPPLVELEAEPNGVIEGGVYVVNDPAVRPDLFRFEGAWYAYSGGYWYRAPGYRGPFVVVDVRRLPRPILTMRSEHWEHHRRERQDQRGHPGRDDDDRGRGHEGRS